MQISHIIKKYDEKTVVNDVSFSLPKGKVTSLIGPNGAGKSTVMSIISRLIAADNGSVVIEKKDINKWNSKELSKHLAILTQTNNIQMKLTVEELVAFGRFPHSGGRLNSKDKEMIDKAIDYMELETFRERFIDELSGGQRQRVYIAMVIAQDSRIIIMDEPVTYLDLEGKRTFFSMVNKLKKSGKTIILVLHDLSDAIRISDNLVIMNDRKIAISDTPANCLKTHIIEDVFHTTYKKFSDDEGDYYIFM